MLLISPCENILFLALCMFLLKTFLSRAGQQFPFYSEFLSSSLVTNKLMFPVYEGKQPFDDKSNR